MISKISSQMLKGILSGCILVLLSKKSLYGYTLGVELANVGFKNVPKGTIYPLLLNLEKKGLIQGKSVPSPEGPKRKYYQLTEQGMVEKETFVEEWSLLKNSVEYLLQKENDK